MADLNERLIQCRKDKAAVEAEEKKLLAELMFGDIVELKFGDIVEGEFGDRVMLYGKHGVLRAFGRDGLRRGSNVPTFYTKISNVFEEDFLNLDD